jgi:glutaredoxin-dependent peroxiredoxin
MENPVLEILNNRYAGRAITGDPLDDQIMADLKEAVRLTPSCFNNQPWRFLWLTGKDALDKAAGTLAPSNRNWAERAPLLVIGYSRVEDDCAMKDGRQYHTFDLGMSVMNLLLAATTHGLAARPMAGFNPAKVKEAFGLAEDEQPLVVIAIGRPGDDESHLEDYQKLENKPRERKSIEEIIKVL